MKISETPRPVYGYALAYQPKSGHSAYLVSIFAQLKRDLITKAEEWGGMSWDELQQQGYFAVAVEVRPVEKK